MRALFFGLLIANVVFFGWARWVDKPQGAAPVPQEGTVPTLALAHTRAVAAAVPTPKQIPRPDRRCRSLGPFPDPASAQVATVVLHARGIEAHDRTADSTVTDGYWVYLSDVGDESAQRHVLTQLQQGGIDATVVTNATEPARVSVGVFSVQARAVRRAEQVRALGLKPILDLHQRVQRSYWLDMDLRPDQPEPPVATLQSSSAATAGSSAGAAIAFADCPAGDKHG